MPRVPIDIVVPVYNAADDLNRCIESVLAHTGGDYRLIVIDDASPDPAVRAYFAQLETRRLPQIRLLANERNLGFTLNANRGMSAARAGADLVLLNSDTVVTRGWLDALARCAAADPAIGTITPFSNNAEICSLPRFCENAPPCPPTPICRRASGSAFTSAAR
jgi:GT2 family glycosyltransferase